MHGNPSHGQRAIGVISRRARARSQPVAASTAANPIEAQIGATIVATIAAAVMRARTGDHDPREVVDLTFDAFGEEGAGALASWMILSGNEDALDPILEAIHGLVDQLAEDKDMHGPALHEETLSLVLMALGDALLGGPMAKALRLPREMARELAVRQLTASRLAAGLPIKV